MESLGFGHNFGAYEQGERQQQEQIEQTEQRTEEYYDQNLKLINRERVQFAATMKVVGKFIFFMSLSGGAVFLSRVLPIFSFAGIFVRIITFTFLTKEAVFNPIDTEKRDFQLLLLAVGLGNLGAEWDSWLAISLAITDFFALYGVSILIGIGMFLGVLFWLLFRNNQNNQAIGLDNENYNYNGDEDYE